MGSPGVNQQYNAGNPYSGYGATNLGQTTNVNAGLGAAPAQIGAMITGNAGQPGGNTVHTVQQNPEDQRIVTLVTLIVFIWKDSFLCLREEFVPAFVKGDTTKESRDPEDEEMAPLEAKPYVFWNSGQGICRLVPLSQLKGAFTACQPLRIHAIQVFDNLFNETMFEEIFRQKDENEKLSYHVVGGLDSNSQGSNFLQWRIKEAWTQVQRQQPQQAQMQAQAQAQVQARAALAPAQVQARAALAPAQAQDQDFG
jgi:hypothetical protein